mmetsp:Transcript_27401/g.55980  ORF Transcript_27401/g.55980 Transcript_27401/m.55980 type:complete len:215 (+) Transcript_27401:166-810(+)
MKFFVFLFIAAVSTVSSFTDSFSMMPLLQRQYSPSASSSVFKSNSSSAFQTHHASTTALQMSDFDFPSAMPEKPQQTMREKLEDSATTFIADITARLGEGVEPPPELEALQAARDEEGGDAPTLALKIYELMIEQGMRYDVDPDNGKLTPTQFDIKNNLDIPEVKAEFDHLYKYGMELIRRGMLDIDVAKETVKEKLIKRTGLTPEEFDEWLGY